ncbi:MAG: DUF488 domain-containing protein [candidate division WOR-3 bacterium]|nr:DUF488 domain-containing protein [candidate division WOR-3 bacterium]
MEIYTVGFAGKTAQAFFGALKRAGVRRVIDVRLRPNGGLSLFARGTDLPFLLRELCGAEYVREPLLAPTKEILSDYRKKRTDWPEYERRFRILLDERDIARKLDKKLFGVPSVLLCSEAKPEQCHRRLAAEYLRSHWSGVTVTHL